MASTSRWLSPLLKYLLGLAVLAYVLWTNWEPKPGASGPGLAEILQGDIRPAPFLFAAILTATALLISVFRWWTLVRALGLPLSMRDAYRLGLLGYFFNTLLPGSIGGDLVKAAALVRRQDRRTAGVASILIDRAVGLIGLVALVALTGGLAWLAGAAMLDERAELRQVVTWSFILLAGAAAGWVLLGFLPQWRDERFARRLNKIPKVGGAASEFWKAVWIYRRTPAAVFRALFLSMGLHTLNVLAFHNAVRAFAPQSDEVPGIGEHLILVPVGLVVKALFPAPGGAGGGEFGFGKLYEFAGRNPALGVSGSFAMLILAWLLGALAYFTAAIMRPAVSPDSSGDHADSADAAPSLP